jgi:uncharacterized protein YndB with AHSA1/START domain
MNTKPPASDIAAWLKSTERQVRRVGDSRSAVLHRRFDHALDGVWAACTDRNHLRRWFGGVSGDLHEAATLTIDVGADCKVTSRILGCEPPHRLLVTCWYGGFPPEHVDQVELRLAADGDGAWLELEHRSDDKTDWWFGAGSGWEFALIRLRVLLQGDDPAKVSAEHLDSKLGPLWASIVVGN